MFKVVKIKIKEMLEKKGVTRYRVAKDTGLPYNTLLKLENNKMKTIDFTVMDKLCDYFKCTPNDLFWEKS